VESSRLVSVRYESSWQRMTVATPSATITIRLPSKGDGQQ
jgi:hypothetical protein